MTHVFFFKLNQTSRRKTKKHFSIFAKTLKPFFTTKSNWRQYCNM